METVIAENARHRFLTHGVLHYPGLLEKGKLEALRESCENALERYLDDPQHPDEGNVSAMRNLTDPRWHKSSPEGLQVILETIADPDVLKPIEEVFGERAMLRSTTLLFNPNDYSRVGMWHRDTQYKVSGEDELKQVLSRQPVDATHIQIALQDSDDLEYVPYSPGRYDTEEEYYFRVADGGIHAQEAGLSGSERIRVKAGDGLIFNPHGLHRGRYFTDIARRIFMVTYTPVSTPIFDRFSEQPWMNQPGYTDGLSERALQMVEEFNRTYST